MAQFFEIHPDNPQERLLLQVVKIIEKGGLIIYPTDTVYGIGCDFTNEKAVQKIAQIKGVKKLKNARFSFICNDLSHLSDYAKQINTSQYKLLKRTLPGPYTFILSGSKKLPRHFKEKKEVGIRVPDNLIARTIVQMLGRPIITTSLLQDDDISPYPTDPELIFEEWQNKVDAVISSGMGNNLASTVVDLTSDLPEVLREGAGDVDLVY